MPIFQSNAYTYVEYSDVKKYFKILYRGHLNIRHNLQAPCGVYNF